MKLQLILAWLILGLVGCTYNTYPEDVTMEDYSNKKGWSASGELFPGSGDDVSVHLQADFKDAPGNYTVQFNLKDPTSRGLLEFVRAKAELIWSVEGNSVRRVVDCVNGMSITGTAQAVAVNITDDSTFLSADTPYTVSTQVVRGARPSVQQPPTLHTGFTGVSFLAPASSGDIDIPADSGVISVQILVLPDVGEPAIPAGSVKAFFTSNGVGTKLMAYDPTVNTGWIPVPPAANTLSIESEATAPNTLWSVIFGIDG